MSSYRLWINTLIAALGISAFGVQPVSASTYMFTTAPGAVVRSGGNAYPVDAVVTFITALDQITVQITNLQTEDSHGNVIQTIGAVDFQLSGLSAGSLSPNLIGWQGEAGNLTHSSGNTATFADSGSYMPGGTVTNLWNVVASTQISGGLELTPLIGKNSTETILGPPNDPSTDTYNASGNLIGANPLLRTQANTYIEYVIHFSPGFVSDTTVVDAVRMTWGVSFGASNELDLEKIPEPGAWGLMLGGLGLLITRSRLRSRKIRSDQKD